MIVSDSLANIHDMFDDLVNRTCLIYEFWKTIWGAYVFAAYEIRREVDHDDGVAFLDKVENVVGHVAGMWTNAVHAGVREDGGSEAALPAFFGRACKLSVSR